MISSIFIILLSCRLRRTQLINAFNDDSLALFQALCDFVIIRAFCAERDGAFFETFAAVRTVEEVRSAIADNPFAAEGEPDRVHTLFLDGEVDPDQFRVLLAAYEGRGPEKIASGPRCLYVDYVDGAGNSKLTGAFIERKLGRRQTARSLRSLQRILEKMES